MVADVDEMFLPAMPSSCMVRASDEKCAALCEQVLDLIPTVAARKPPNECCFGAAVQAGHKLLKKGGGKLMVVLSDLPNAGTGALKNRDQMSFHVMLRGE